MIIPCATLLVALLICSWPWSNGVGQSEEGRLGYSYNESQSVGQSPSKTTELVNDESEGRAKIESLPIQTIPARLRARAALYEPLMHRAADKYGVDARILWIIAYLETRFQPDLISPVGASGLMQFMPATATAYGLKNPYNPAESIDAAARYVRDLQARFGDRFDLILASYNAGEGTVDAYLRGYALRLPTGRIINPRGQELGGIPPYIETRNYVARGLELARLLGASNFSLTNLVENSPVLTRSSLNRQATLPIVPKSQLKASTYATSNTAKIPTRPLSEVTDQKRRSLRPSDTLIR